MLFIPEMGHSAVSARFNQSLFNGLKLSGMNFEQPFGRSDYGFNLVFAAKEFVSKESVKRKTQRC